MKRGKKHLVPLSELLKDECLGDIAAYADCIYIDTAAIASLKNETDNHQNKKQNGETNPHHR